jgi:hypothetical protein
MPTAKKPKLIQVRTSERQTFNRCEWQWWRSYHDKLTPITDAPALRFGTLIHAALELRYPPGIKRGPHPAETFERLYEEELADAMQWGFRDADGEWADAAELGVAMLNNYVDTYGRDEEWKVLASELPFQVPVMDPDTGEPLFEYVGTIDGVWQDRVSGGVRINDYKTCAGDPVKEAQGKFVLDEQATAYWTWGVDYLIENKVLKPRELEALDGMLYTFLYKAGPDERPVNAQGQSLNKDGSVSKIQPVPRFHRELVYRDEIQREKARRRAVRQFKRMQAIRDGELEPYKSIGTGYPDQQCKACAFSDLCEMDESGADWFDLRDAAFKTWDPYDAHEIQEEGKH